MSLAVERNLGLNIMRATEAGALVAARWVGRGEQALPDRLAAQALQYVLSSVDMDGTIVIGEEQRHEDTVLTTGTHIGNGNEPAMDVIIDSVEGIRLLEEGLPDAVSVVGLAPRGSITPLNASLYMEKLAFSAEVGDAIGPEAMDAPVGWILGVAARAMGKSVHEMTVFVLKRQRHQGLIDDLRKAGARVLLRTEGDVIGALLAALPDTGVDLLMGIGGTTEGLMAACAVMATGGSFLGRLAPQSPQERQQVLDAGLNLKQIYRLEDLVSSEDVFFAATGITDGLLLRGVRYHSGGASTHSLVLRGKSGIRRYIVTEHPIAHLPNIAHKPKA